MEEEDFLTAKARRTPREEIFCWKKVGRDRRARRLVRGREEDLNRQGAKNAKGRDFWVEEEDILTAKDAKIDFSIKLMYASSVEIPPSGPICFPYAVDI